MAIYTDIKFLPIDVSVDGFTDAMEIPLNERITINPGATNITGSPMYTLQCSGDKINWFDYSTESTDVPYDDSVEFYIPFRFKFMRFKITASASSGSLYFIVNF